MLTKGGQLQSLGDHVLIRRSSRAKGLRFQKRRCHSTPKSGGARAAIHMHLASLRRVKDGADFN